MPGRCRWMLMLLTTGLAAATADARQVAFKQIGAPASDVERGWLLPPDPQEHGARARCSQVPFLVEHDTTTITFEVPLTDHLTIVPLGPGSVGWTVTLFDPAGQLVSAEVPTTRWRTDTIHPLAQQQALRIDIKSPEPGTWTVRIADAPRGTHGVLIVRDDHPVVLRTTVDSFQLLQGQPRVITIAPVLEAGPALLGQAAREAHDHGIELLEARATWHSGDGANLPVTVNHDRMLGTAVIVPGAGEHVLQVDALIRDTATGTTMTRTALHRLKVVADPPVLSGEVHLETIDDDRVAITMPCTESGTRDRLVAGAEVWALGKDGMTRCAWIGGMVPVDARGVSLTLDTRWISSTQLSGEQVELRNVRLADPGSFITLASLDHLPLGEIAVSRSPVDEHTVRELRMGGGRRGSVAVEAPPARGGSPGGHNLMLVHGYCSDADSWPPSHFTGDVSVYVNQWQNFSNDRFALDVWAFGDQFKSYGIAGHSQGGNAGLHLYSFYWSGLDWATPDPDQGGRLIQALGAPFYGTSLAGNLALIAEVFGFGCGTNWDMTYDGASLWVSYIPGWARAETWTWTTTFTDDWWSYDYCHLATDLFLDDPEDGVVESFSGDLDGANFGGLKEGWCHIQGMTESPQVHDSSRNGEIDSEAAR